MGNVYFSLSGTTHAHTLCSAHSPVQRFDVLLYSFGQHKPCTMPGAVGFTNRAVSSAHGAACTLGAILARLAAAANATTTAAAGSNPNNSFSSRAWAALSQDALPSALSSLAAAIGHPVSLLHVAACGAVGRVGALGPLPVYSTAAGSSATTIAAGGSGSGEDSRVTATVQAVFERLWAACRLGETTDASRRTEAAAEALGKCCRGEGGVGASSGGKKGEEASARVRKTLQVLFDMAKNQVCTCG